VRDPLIGIERLDHMHQAQRSTASFRKRRCRLYGYFSPIPEVMTNNNSFQRFYTHPLF
jgi:hypothetical protein